MAAKLLVREAKPWDIPHVIALGEYMRAESAVPFPPIVYTHAMETGNIVLENEDACFLVVENDGEIVGFLLGGRGDSLWSPLKTASVILLYMAPEHRSLFILRRLLRHFEEWAGNVFSCDVGVSTGLNLENVMKFFKYYPTGANYRKVNV